MLFPVDHGNSSIKTANFVFPPDWPIIRSVHPLIRTFWNMAASIGRCPANASLICGTRRKMTDILS